jgi:hypothetical protein
MSSTPDPIDPTADFLLDFGGQSGAPAHEPAATDAARHVAGEAPVVETEDGGDGVTADATAETHAAGDSDHAQAVVGDESAAGPPADEDEVAAVVEQAAYVEPDPRLLAAHDLALAALREITPESTIGEPVDYRVEPDGVVSLRFANRLAGYPGWFWTVSLARVEDAEPTVLEVELLPGDGALLAPDWVPWAVRLADYHAAQAALAEATHAEDEPEEDHEELDDVDDLDASDFDDDGSPILHAGDVDGVDIDELADASPDDDEVDDSEDDDDQDEDDDDADEDDDSDEDDSDEFDSDEDDDSDDDDSDSDEDDSDEFDSDDEFEDEDDSDDDDSDEFDDDESYLREI